MQPCVTGEWRKAIGIGSWKCKTEENGRSAMNGQPSAWEALSDCCMVAAELFCGIEQTTTVYYRWWQCQEPRIRPLAWNTSSHDNTKDKWIPRLHEIASGHTWWPSHFVAQCQTCVTGDWRLSVRALTPWVLYPMATAMYWKDTGLITPYVSTGAQSEPVITTLDASKPWEMSDSHGMNL
jgi:hypothetical protein